jgi:hypothetical protein
VLIPTDEGGRWEWREDSEEVAWRSDDGGLDKSSDENSEGVKPGTLEESVEEVMEETGEAWEAEEASRGVSVV